MELARSGRVNPCADRSFRAPDQLSLASSDETVQITSYPPEEALTRPFPPLHHPLPVRAILPLSLTPLLEPYVVTAYGDVIRLYDLSTISEPEILGEIDAHWHDVTAVRLWMRTSKNEAGQTRIEPWIVSTSLDGTIRKWRFSGKYDLYGRRPSRIELHQSSPPPPPIIPLAEQRQSSSPLFQNPLEMHQQAS